MSYILHVAKMLNIVLFVDVQNKPYSGDKLIRSIKLRLKCMAKKLIWDNLNLNSNKWKHKKVEIKTSWKNWKNMMTLLQMMRSIFEGLFFYTEILSIFYDLAHLESFSYSKIGFSQIIII